jgi:hypothetical protein
MAVLVEPALATFFLTTFQLARLGCGRHCGQIVSIILVIGFRRLATLALGTFCRFAAAWLAISAPSRTATSTTPAAATLLAPFSARFATLATVLRFAGRLQFAFLQRLAFVRFFSFRIGVLLASLTLTRLAGPIAIAARTSAATAPAAASARRAFLIA